MTTSDEIELCHLFNQNAKVRPIILLGAGASFRSGIPTAGACVHEIAKAHFLTKRKGIVDLTATTSPSDWMPHLEKQPWFLSGKERLAENFPMAVEHMLTPKEFRKDVLNHILASRETINPGYTHLAKLVQLGRVRTILTTNFDSLIVDAFKAESPHFPKVIEINRTSDEVAGKAEPGLSRNSSDRWQVL